MKVYKLLMNSYFNIELKYIFGMACFGNDYFTEYNSVCVCLDL
jgi:hypothetical protein